MKKLFYLMACCLLGGLFWQCKDDDKSDGPYTFKFPIENYTAPQAAGKKLVEFTTADTWTAKLNYVKPLASDEAEWCVISPTSGGAGKHTLTIALTENLPYDDRAAEIVITSGGQTQTLKVLQTNISGIVCEEPTQNVDYQGGTVTFNISANCEYDVEIPEDVKHWVTLVASANASKAMTDRTLTVKVNPNDGFNDRIAAIVLTEKGDVNSDLAKMRIRVMQTSLDEKYLIANDAVAAASVVKNADGSVDAWYLYGSSSTLSSIQGFGDPGQAPVDVSTAAAAQRMKVPAPFNRLTVITCTWDQGDMPGLSKIYAWDTDYATTVAGSPVVEFETVMHNNAPAVELLPNGTTLPAGDYLVVLSAPKSNTGIWASPKPGNGSVNFIGGNATSSQVMKTEYYLVNDQGKVTGGYKHSADGGHTWGDAVTLVEMTTNNGWLTDAPSDMSVAKCGNYYYATFDKANQVYVARSSAAKGPWKTWNGAGWGTAAGSPVVDTTAAASLVERNGTLYAYYVKRNRVYVATAASSESWPGSLTEKGMAYKFPEEGTIKNVYAKFHSDINKFVVLYTYKRETIAVVSDDGLTFTRSTIGVNPILDNTYGVQYVMDASGVVTGGDQYFSYGVGTDLYFRPRVK